MNFQTIQNNIVAWKGGKNKEKWGGNEMDGAKTNEKAQLAS
ncbi:MAG: hypothetical protein AB7P49_18435 [Bdellovibrionales bacterium]